MAAAEVAPAPHGGWAQRKLIPDKGRESTGKLINAMGNASPTHSTLCLCLCVCVANEACVGNNERRRNWERNSHPVMKHVAKDSSARAGNWIDTFGYGRRRWYKDRDKPAGGELMRLLVVASLVVASQPSQPMIALVSDELGMPQN